MAALNTRYANGSNRHFAVIVFSLSAGDVTALDVDYDLCVRDVASCKP